MRSNSIVALDPGGTTGWALYLSNEDLFQAGQLGPEPHHTALWELLDELDPSVVVTESFEYRNRARPGLVLVSLEYIGVTQLWCNEYGRKLYKQTASMAKGFVKDEHLKKLHVYMKGQPHAMDATRHLLYHLCVTEENRVLLAQGWGPTI